MSQNSFPREPDLDVLGPVPNHTSKADLQMMADAMQLLTGKYRLFFAVELMVNGLMKPHVEGDEVVSALLTQAEKMGVLPAIAEMMFAGNQELVDDFIGLAVEHCVNGSDQTNPTSAGGWNEAEVETAYAALYVARCGLSIPFGANVQ